MDLGKMSGRQGSIQKARQRKVCFHHSQPHQAHRPEFRHLNNSRICLQKIRLILIKTSIFQNITHSVSSHWDGGQPSNLSPRAIVAPSRQQPVDDHVLLLRHVHLIFLPQMIQINSYWLSCSYRIWCPGR